MILITGPKEPHSKRKGLYVINACSVGNDWASGLSPFLVGPCALYNGYSSITMENAWQYAKIYKCHADNQGNPTNSYWQWAKKGWNNPRAVRYPMGKGAIPICSLWNGERFSYVTARKKIYFPLYRDAVRKTDSFKQLKKIYEAERNICIWDFDGYDHDGLGMTLRDVLNSTEKKMGHAFVLKMMLLYGEDVTPEVIDNLCFYPNSIRTRTTAD